VKGSRRCRGWWNGEERKALEKGDILRREGDGGETGAKETRKLRAGGGEVVARGGKIRHRSEGR